MLNEEIKTTVRRYQDTLRQQATAAFETKLSSGLAREMANTFKLLLSEIEGWENYTLPNGDVWNAGELISYLLEENNTLTASYAEYQTAIATSQARIEKMQDAVSALYYAGVWSCDRDVNAGDLWSTLRDAADLPVGNSPKPLPKQEITLVRADDWEGLYIDGKLAIEAGEIQYREFAIKAGITLKEVWVDEQWLEEAGSIPEDLKDVKVKK